MGPIIDVWVGVSKARLQAIQAAGQPPPQLVLARLLVDTGASSTNLCHTVIQQLALTPTGSVPVHTPSTGTTPVSMPQYDVNLYFAFPTVGASVHTAETVPIICADFSAQSGMDGLLGRDILARGLLTYHGDINLCTFSL